MKTTLPLFIGMLALAGMSYAGPSESAAFAIRHAQESAAMTNAPVLASTSDNGSFKYVPAPSGKGIVQVPNRDAAVTNIALVKSSKMTSCDSAACCAKR